MGTDEQLAWEAQHRIKSGIAAIFAGLLSLGGGVYSGLILSDVPRTTVFEGLDSAARSGPIGTQPSLRVPFYQWYDDHIGELVLGAGITALGALLLGAALTFLAYATAARRAEFPRAALYIAIVGAVLLAVAAMARVAGTNAFVDDLLATSRTVDAIDDVEPATLLTVGQLIEVVGRFTLGAAFVLISLNAMRSGLLTRFMGVLGIIAGVLLALPVFGGPLPVVQSVWLFALGLLFVGRWPGGTPPAWVTGKAEPWPTGAEMRQARTGASPAAPDPEPEAPATSAPHPASKKKRKKRR